MIERKNVNAALQEVFNSHRKKKPSEIIFWLDGNNEKETIFEEMEKTFKGITQGKRKWFSVKKKKS